MISSLTAECLVERAVPALDSTVRKARMRDIAAILDLINGYAAKGIMLPRTEFEMSENIRDFTVVTARGPRARLRRAALLQPDRGRDPLAGGCRGSQSARRGPATGGGAGRGSRRLRLDAVFAFTYVVEFFRKVGFSEVERGELPLKAWKDCLRCPKFQCCDEIAMLQRAAPGALSRMDRAALRRI